MIKRYQSIPSRPLARRHAERRDSRSRYEHLLSILSLVVAMLATVGTIAQSVLLYQQGDAPYSALVYDEQVSRAVKAVDFMTALRADFERWENLHEAHDAEERGFPAEVRQRMVHFAALSEEAWLLTPKAQDAIARAATDFARVGKRCLVPRYDVKDASDGSWSVECDRLFAAHDASLRAAMRTTREEIGFDRRIKSFEPSRMQR